MGDDKKKSRLRLWLKRIGVAGFLFFLIKGLIWLLIFFGGYELIKDLLQ